MSQLIDPTWWFSLFPQLASWWFVCVLASLLAWPVCLVFFRGLPDRGASLASGVGLIAVMVFGWLASLEWFTGGSRVALLRLLILFLAVSAGIAALWARQRKLVYGVGNTTVFIPAGILLLLGLFSVPHGFLSGLLGLLMLGGLGVFFWLHRPEEFHKSINLTAVPFVVGQLIFLVGLLFFANVRSYVPWATFEIGLFAAEKWGNYTHLHSLMRTNSFPPPDLWFQGEPINYYYGGHLLTATIAKLSGTPVRIAFNLGLATVFALTLALGFGFTYSLVHIVAHRVRIFGRITWQGGMAWGIFGALAIGMFGNLDSWRQLMTRDVDSGVLSRMERVRQHEQEEWKLRTGLPVEVGQNLWSAMSRTEPWDRTGDLHTRLARLARVEDDPAAKVVEMANQIESRIERASQDPRITRRRLADQVTGVFTSPDATAMLRILPDVNAIALQEDLFRLALDGQFDEIPPRLRAAAENATRLRDWFHRTHKQLDDRLRDALVGEPMQALMGEIQRIVSEGETEGASPLRTAAVEARIRIQNAMEAGNISESINEIKVLADLARSAKDHDPVADRSLRGLVLRAEAPYLWDPKPWLMARWGDLPPPDLERPEIQEIRFGWYNITQVDFWASSRVIKGTPPGVREAGTITEFPYFSAILGDHHPHHSAIPWFLLALCACLSLLRKTARLGWTDASFFRLSWPELFAMAFFIGTVFAVNIWDAVVLAPLYAVVILVARRGVTPAEWWRWVGFVGFLVLLTLIVGIFYNSIPGTAPLFQNFKFFLLAVAVIFPGCLLVRWLVPHLAAWMSLAACLGAAGLAIIVGALLAPGEGGPAPVGSFSIALRDLAFFVVIGGVAASWTLLGRSPVIHRWWYSAGGVYACVGLAALLLTLPFRLWFSSPLQPELEMMAEVLPPILSQEITSTPGQFWSNFWKSSPVNPFDQSLRTELRDYFMHWGLFVVPILLFLIARFPRAARLSQKGFPFMIAMLTVGILGFGRNYLVYWAGAICIAMVVPCLYYAMSFRKRTEGAIWAFLAVGFFWMWFVEALHFDDDYSGHYERYNTPFKIFYPIWAIFAGALVVVIREVFGRSRVKFKDAGELLREPTTWVLLLVGGILLPALLSGRVPASFLNVYLVLFWVTAVVLLAVLVLSLMRKIGSESGEAACGFANAVMARWPAMVVIGFFLVVGMHYPLAATATRTREFFTHPWVNTPEARFPNRQLHVRRTLDALDHLQHYDNYRQDYKAITWLEGNMPRGTRVLEQATENAYSHAGRISTGAGLISVISWKHHQHQWRGRAKAAPDGLKERYFDEVNNLHDLTSAFRNVMPGFEGEIPADVQRDLRMADPGERLDILRVIFPTATLNDLHRLRRQVDRHDLSMNHVMARMLGNVHRMYRETDRDRVAELMTRYGIDIVVVGKLERDAHGDGIEERLESWGFEKIFDSSEEEFRLPFDSAVINDPTRVYRVPGEFRNFTGGVTDG